MKNNRGISLITLSVAIIIMLIIVGTMVYNAKDSQDIRKLNDMYTDIEILNDKISTWYIRYGTIPASEVYTNTSKINEINNANQISSRDNDVYYKIDLPKIENLTLYYGRGYADSSSEDIYIINEQSHKIYYVQGIQSDNITYYTNEKND